MLVPLWTAPSSAPERRHEAGAGNPTDAPLFERKHEIGVNGATDTVKTTNPAPTNTGTVSSKEVKEAKEFKETVDRTTTSNDGSKQSQGTSNSYPIILATRPPLNLATAAHPYAGETPLPHSKGDQGAPSQAGTAPADAKKAPAATTQTVPGTSTPKDAVVDEKTKVATQQSGPTAAGAADDNTPHLEIDAQALAVRNQSPKGPFNSLDVSGSAVWKNKNLGPEHKFASGNELSIGHEPQGGATVSSQIRNPNDATTPGVTRPPAVSVHPQLSGQVGIANYTIKDRKGNDSLEFELDATLQVDLYGGKAQLQGSLQAGVEGHITDKVSVVGQVSMDQNASPSVGVGVKVVAW